MVVVRTHYRNMLRPVLRAHQPGVVLLVALARVQTMLDAEEQEVLLQRSRTIPSYLICLKN